MSRRWITPPEWDDRDFDNPVDPFRQGVGDPYSRLDHLDGLSAPVRARAPRHPKHLALSGREEREPNKEGPGYSPTPTPMKGSITNV